MKAIISLILVSILPLFSFANNEIEIMNCEKKDFFYWGQSLTVKLIKSNDQNIIRFTYQNGIASTKVQQLFPLDFFGGSKYLAVSLKHLVGDKYSFLARDSYDGRLSIGPVQVVCSRSK